jgi:hypothetical protein
VIKSFIELLLDFDILYYLIYIIALAVGLLIHPFYFAFHLMDFLKLEQLKSVVQAIWHPKIEILLSIMLLLIMEYYFSILGFVFLGN